MEEGCPETMLERLLGLPCVKHLRQAWSLGLILPARVLEGFFNSWGGGAQWESNSEAGCRVDLEKE